MGRLRLKRRGWIGIALVAVALAGAWMLVGGSGSSGSDGATTAGASDQAELPPLPWESDATAPAPAPEPKPVSAKPPAPADATAAGADGGGIPPASAGSNGSYTPRPDSERKSMTVRTHAADGPYSAERTAFLLGNTALPPAAAPEPIQGAISAANMITDQPYVWGGGHASFQSAGYDCSGAVSYALAGGGMLGAPATSGQLMSWGVPGKGRWLTVYANAGHAYVVIAGLRFDTVGNAKGSGPRWHPADAYPSGFAARHMPGL